MGSAQVVATVLAGAVTIVAVGLKPCSTTIAVNPVLSATAEAQAMRRVGISAPSAFR